MIYDHFSILELIIFRNFELWQIVKLSRFLTYKLKEQLYLLKYHKIFMKIYNLKKNKK